MAVNNTNYNDSNAKDVGGYPADVIFSISLAVGVLVTSTNLIHMQVLLCSDKTSSCV